MANVNDSIRDTVMGLAIYNPKLVNTLSKSEYPLDDYAGFAVSWPHHPNDIKDTHRLLYNVGVLSNKPESVKAEDLKPLSV